MPAVPKIPYMPMQEELDNDMLEKEDNDIKTCHLCGKASCGKRKGRVRCAKCKRIFCIQQLVKKFRMKVVKDQPDFICPRCLGLCCCVTDCTLPPPHVHCKVYKVRLNKKKCRENSIRENVERDRNNMYDPAPIVNSHQPLAPAPLPQSSSFSLFPQYPYYTEARLPYSEEYSYPYKIDKCIIYAIGIT